MGLGLTERARIGSKSMNMSHTDIMSFTLLSLGIPLVILWRLRTMGWGVRLAIIGMFVTFIIVDAGLWHMEW